MESSKSDAASGKPTAERLVLLITGGASGAPFLFLPVSYPERSLPLETTKLISEVKDTEKRLAAARETAKAACLSTINEELAKLKSIGFDYELTPKNGNEKLCGSCGKKGHNTRGCPERKGEPNGKQNRFPQAEAVHTD